MTRIKKTTNPTTIFPPITKVPKVCTTPPASPVDKMDLVVDTLSPRRNRVVNNKREGKIENSRASLIFIVNNKMSSANVILSNMRILNNQVGNGIINIAIMRITPITTIKSFLAISSAP